MKRCGHCNEVKPLTEFYRCASARDGVQGWCADCRKKQKYRRKPGPPEPPETRLTPEQKAYYQRRLKNPKEHIDELLSESIPSRLCVGLLATGKSGRVGGRRQSITLGGMRSEFAHALLREGRHHDLPR